MQNRLRPAAALALLLALALTGCRPAAGAGAVGGSGRLDVVASFYPLQYVARRIAGDAATVTSLTRPGAEPHDLELTPRDLVTISKADVVLYVKGFQAAVDEAVAEQARTTALDAAPQARLDLTYTPIEDGESQRRQAGSVDPHFWQDPTRLAAVAAALAARLEAVDPARAGTFRANAAALQADLARLDGEFRAGLAHCAVTELVTSHNAFGYLGRRYGLDQVGITGLTPDQEPSPTQLAAVTRFVREHHVRTIYYETLASPDIARTVAAETGARTDVLDPIEGLTKQSRGGDYLAVMRSNLAALRAGQDCS